MSYLYVSDVLHGCFGIRPSAKLVLLIIAEHANGNSGGIAWPSVATIARLAGLSERQVQVHLTKLIGQGWIFTTGRRGGGAGNATRYQLNLARMRAVQQQKGESGNTHSKSGKGEAHCTVSAAEGVKSSAEKGEVQRQKRVKPTAPEPEVNHREPAKPESNANGADKKPRTGRSIDKPLPPEPQGLAAREHPYRTPEARAGLQRLADVVKGWTVEPLGKHSRGKSGLQ